MMVEVVFIPYAIIPSLKVPMNSFFESWWK